MKKIYLVAAVIGTVIPYYFFLQPMDSAGLALADFLAQGFANPVAAGFSADLFIASFVFWIYMFTAGAEAPRPWAFIAMNLLIGLSCALPAYLYWRERSTSFRTAPA